MGKIFIGIGILYIGILMVFTIELANNDRSLNIWTARCNRDGGQVETVRYGFASDDLECFKNGKIIDHEN